MIGINVESLGDGEFKRKLIELHAKYFQLFGNQSSKEKRDKLISIIYSSLYPVLSDPNNEILKTVVFSIMDKKTYPKVFVINNVINAFSRILNELNLPNLEFTIENGNLTKLNLPLDEKEITNAFADLNIDASELKVKFTQLNLSLETLRNQLNQDIEDIIPEYDKLKNNFSKKEYYTKFLKPLLPIILATLCLVISVYALSTFAVLYFTPAAYLELAALGGLSVGGLAIANAGVATVAIAATAKLCSIILNLPQDQHLKMLGHNSKDPEATYDEQIHLKLLNKLDERAFDFITVLNSAQMLELKISDQAKAR